MSGVFAQWQPRYAEKRIATFPVGADKKPCIKNWNKVGLKWSERLVEFQSTNALGFPLGSRSGVTLLDLDTKDADLLEDVQSRYGPSPFKVETAGGYHLYYRYGGERRHIRPWGPDIPVDVLGGGYAVAPPSVAAKGPYEIIHGTLDDLNTCRRCMSCWTSFGGQSRPGSATLRYFVSALNTLFTAMTSNPSWT